ncbi:MAG: RsmD family RNA methyltransferase, partial [Nitriliruptoraceae bacterium]
ERVLVEVVEDHKRWARARVVTVMDASADRVAPPCPVYKDCGGCDLQHIAPTAQRRLKTRVVVEQLERLGGIVGPAVAECRAVGPDVRYRTNVQFHSDERGRLGFYRRGSHDVVPVADCLVATEAVGRIRHQLTDAGGADRVAVRAHDATATSAVIITPGPGGLTLPDGNFDVVLEQPDGSAAPIRGTGVLAETVGPHRFEFDATAFFQVSPAAATALTDAVMSAVGDVSGALVWDLYAGVGLFSLPLAAAGAEVVAVESHRQAAAAAQHNADANQLAVSVHPGDVSSFISATISGIDAPDVVVLDPPRSGAGSAVIKQLAKLRPAAIVYVACDVAALARDARTLTSHNYRLSAAQPLDLFPMTHHIEVVATFVPSL